jgi:MFS transporter, BCD family, chlorophyll transporter
VTHDTIGWPGIVRFGLVQSSLGAIVVLTTSTINRVMIVELAFAAVIPGVLVAWHYALQILRPRWGHGSDNGGRRTPWIIGGMAILGTGGLLAAVSLWVAASMFWPGLLLSFLAFTLIGIGVGAAGTSMLVLLAESVRPDRRAAAATIVWTMMIVGFILTTVLAGKFLDPFSLERLVGVAAVVAATSFIVSSLAVWGIEKEKPRTLTKSSDAKNIRFSYALRDVWRDDDARRFALFIFISMFAYSAQDLILEPFAGLIFNFTPAQSTSLSGTQNSGALTGMILVGVAVTWFGRTNEHALRNWTILGCLGSALALAGLVIAARVGVSWPLELNVFALGFANGLFAVAAIGSMFSAAAGKSSREGIRMGLFGASQAIAFGAGGIIGTALADVLRVFTQSVAVSYGVVFSLEAALFLLSAVLALRIGHLPKQTTNPFVLAAQHDLRG